MWKHQSCIDFAAFLYRKIKANTATQKINVSNSFWSAFHLVHNSNLASRWFTNLCFVCGCCCCCRCVTLSRINKFKIQICWFTVPPWDCPQNQRSNGTECAHTHTHKKTPHIYFIHSMSSCACACVSLMLLLLWFFFFLKEFFTSSALFMIFDGIDFAY